MEGEKKTPNKGSDYLKKLFFNNLGIKIAAVLIATVIWGAVLTTQNPPRSKLVQDVRVSFINEYELHSRELVVRGNPLEEYGNIAVRVNTPITNYADLAKDNLTATVNLNSITSTGVWMLPILVTTNRTAGSVVDAVIPDKLQLEIDKLMTKRVPVEVNYEGTLPEGYYADIANMRLSDTTLQISGPQQDARLVTKAICRVQLNNRTQSYNDTMDIILQDENGNEIDSSLFIGSMPTVTVNLPIYPKKTVPINVEQSLLGEDNLAANYELYDTSAIPETLDIIGDANVLAEIEYLTVQGIDVTGRRESIHARLPLNVPNGIIKILNTNVNLEEIEVFIDIREKQNSKTFEAIPITYRDLGKGLTVVNMTLETVDISVQGRVTLVDLLERNNITAFVDLKGLKQGEHVLPVSIYLSNDQTTLELTSIQSVSEITVKIE